MEKDVLHIHLLLHHLVPTLRILMIQVLSIFSILGLILPKILKHIHSTEEWILGRILYCLRNYMWKMILRAFLTMCLQHARCNIQYLVRHKSEVRCFFF